MRDSAASLKVELQERVTADILVAAAVWMSFLVGVTLILKDGGL